MDTVYGTMLLTRLQSFKCSIVDSRRIPAHTPAFPWDAWKRITTLPIPPATPEYHFVSGQALVPSWQSAHGPTLPA